MKIAILLPDLRGGGAERVNLDLAHEFARQGHQVEFVLMKAEGEFLPEARAEFSVVDLGVDRTRQIPAALARYLRTRRPDALVANMWPLTAAAVLGRGLSGVKTRLLLMEHNTLSKQYRSWGPLHSAMMRLSMVLGYRRADFVGAVSAGSAADTARLALMSPGKVHVLHNPIRPRPAPSAEELAQADAFWGAPPGARILTVGGFKEQKNHPLLLQAFAALRGSPEARLMFLGQGPMEAELRNLSQSLGIADRVIFAGFHANPTPFYQTADLFVLSSDYEGLPTVLIEALASGTPVVSTNCPSGPAEILQGGRYGTLVPVGDAPAIAAAISTTLAKPHDADLLRRRAANFAPAIAARAYLSLIT